MFCYLVRTLFDELKLHLIKVRRKLLTNAMLLQTDFHFWGYFDARVQCIFTINLYAIQSQLYL